MLCCSALCGMLQYVMYCNMLHHLELYVIVCYRCGEDRLPTGAIEGPRQAAVASPGRVLGRLRPLFFPDAPQVVKLFATLARFEGSVGHLEREGFDEGCVEKGLGGSEWS